MCLCAWECMWSQVRIKYFWMCKAFHFFFCTKKTMRMKINRKKWQSSFCLYIDFWKLIFRFIIQIWSPAPVVKGHHAQRGVAGRWGNSSSLIQKGAELPDEAYNWCSPCNVTNCAPTEYKYLLDSLGYLNLKALSFIFGFQYLTWPWWCVFRHHILSRLSS